jgi:hypothetical protein
MEFSVERCPNNFARPAVERDHYLKKWPHPKSLPFSYRLLVDGRTSAPDGRPFGLMVWKQLQHGRQRGLFGYEGLPTKWQVLDLARVWVHPELQAVQWEGLSRPTRFEDGTVGRRPVTHTLNVFSRMVSAVLARTPGSDSCQLQRDWLAHHPPRFPELPYHVELVISYCQLDHHDGTGYRAANFRSFGLTADRTKEIYFRRLRSPRAAWVPPAEAQAGLFEHAA